MDERNFGFNSETAHRTQKEWDSFLDVQNRVFDVYRDYLVHWVERRQQGAREAMDVTQELISCSGNPRNVMDICSKFVTGSLERWVDDFGEYTRCQTHASQLWQTRMQQSTERAAEETRQAASDMQRAASTPQTDNVEKVRQRG